MGVAMGCVASLVLTIGDPDEAEKQIAAKVTAEELHMMQKFELDDGDGQISRAEYILLCAVRIGALSPDLIGKINERFKILDKSGDGNLDYAEILECPEERLGSILRAGKATVTKMENESFSSRLTGSMKAEKKKSTVGGALPPAIPPASSASFDDMESNASL
jgi:hypothetical protein